MLNKLLKDDKTYKKEKWVQFYKKQCANKKLFINHCIDGIVVKKILQNYN